MPTYQTKITHEMQSWQLDVTAASEYVAAKQVAAKNDFGDITSFTNLPSLFVCRTASGAKITIKSEASCN